MKHLLAAIFLACAVGSAAAHDKSSFLGQDSVRVWHGVGLRDAAPASSDKPTKPSEQGKQDAEIAKIEVGADDTVKIPKQPPFHKAGYRIRCKNRGASSCPLSKVVVDIFDQPAIRRAGGLPSTKIILSTETRDGVEYVVAQVTRRGVAVHQAGIRDDWRVRTHTAGVSTNRNVTVNRAGVSNKRNIRVKRVGGGNKSNIRVKRAGVSNNSNIRVQ